DARAGQVEVVAGVAVGTVGKAVEREEEDEGTVDALGVEDLQQLAQVPALAGLVADVLPAQSDRRAGVLVVLANLHAASAQVAGAAVGGGAELGDREWPALRDERADAFGESVGHLSRPVEIQAHDVEKGPVDALEGDGGVGDLAAESCADAR